MLLTNPTVFVNMRRLAWTRGLRKGIVLELNLDSSATISIISRHALPTYHVRVLVKVFFDYEHELALTFTHHKISLLKKIKQK